MIEVVGVGASGLESLGPDGRRIVDEAEVVVGGERHLAMLEVRPGRRLVPWPSPLLPALRRVLDDAGTGRVVVLASGDPLVSGIGSTLVRELGAEAVRIHPGVSSVALARARMRWAAEDSDVVTLVGRDVDRLRRDLAPRARLVVLTSGDDAPARIASLLVEEGYAGSRLTVLGDLGSPAESRIDGVAASWDGRPAPRLHLVCVECEPRPARSARSLVPGLGETAYDHDGQLTKRVVRAAALAHLAPQPGDVMWDLGAGAGSVGIEFARQHPRNEVHAVERDTERAERVRRNARALGVPGVQVVEAASMDAVAELPLPDAVFVGGGATGPLLEACWAALVPGGRLVVHGVTVETEVLLHEARARFGGSMTRIAVEDLDAIGSLHGWKPARSIVQWSVEKPVTQTDSETDA
ncbi:bifunctional cobalt-precorrin-7 (C(5))-methyltransferase/cobalt-precorrin-6B (C(15))-methyltransferase [Terracoccus sp. 273MFTsu3.1]|uniref:bifunctional cobalt-precorrin-7 (C(5))-methyltransferase/cobalt-precorrin-6B (C(15))-methyltransferase n=1 Tax=Terracoccus sp. 273MFTsu3.1 TaxID=1172188 RepID=UPI00035D0BCC|nr:bifunctional cobalt-precorrin-7 (C(5))-methyltransferase/cobalt-precorrin-6B (C(15))-methyltransferase [Terracoccus sp. 273MFTsu3.1]